jgi:hypothetical protein
MVACVAVVALVVAMSTWRPPDAIPETRAPAGTPPVTSAAAAVDHAPPKSPQESPIRTRAVSPAADRRPRASTAPAIVVSREEVAAFWQLLASPPEETVVFVSPAQAQRAEDGGLLPLPDIALIEVPVLDINPLPRHRDVSETGGGAHE